MSSNRLAGRILWALFSLTLLALAGCGQADDELSTPPSVVVPTPRPTEPPSITRALDGAVFTIQLGDELVAWERFVVQDTQAGQVLYSELQMLTGAPIKQRRTLLLSAGDLPLNYELEERLGGARSLWLAERSGDQMAVLNNDLNLPVPVIVDELTPVPALLIEGRPSALPFVLAAWQLTSTDQPRLELYSLDVTEPLPVVQPVTIEAGGLETGEMIGAIGYRGSMAGALNATFDFWMRESGALVRVRVPDYRFGWSAKAAVPELADGQPLTIQRVSEEPLAEPEAPKGESFVFADAQGVDREAWLRLPEGAGPHPLVMLVGPAGLRPTWQGADALLAEGWAVLGYPPRGLDDPQRRYERGDFAVQADDLMALAEQAAMRKELDAERFLLLGWAEGCLVSAQGLEMGSEVFVGAVLLEPPAAGALFPEAVERRIESELAPAYGWSVGQVADYRALSLDVAREWLFEGVDELTALGRRLDIGYLRDYADANLSRQLAASEQPVLILGVSGGQTGFSISATDLAASLSAAGRDQVSAETSSSSLFVPGTEQLTAESAAIILDWATINLP